MKPMFLTCSICSDDGAGIGTKEEKYAQTQQSGAKNGTASSLLKTQIWANGYGYMSQNAGEIYTVYARFPQKPQTASQSPRHFATERVKVS